jgi:hypothetical protein
MKYIIIAILFILLLPLIAVGAGITGVLKFIILFVGRICTGQKIN